ncbi:zinc ribbon domain-containing protein [Streptomyces mirabilis]|uniref:zinc ribbon domain-containing protein n=1 Tax=Streptomyces mirabilis TaxID=68239 RepID=UPI0036AE773D
MRRLRRRRGRTETRNGLSTVRACNEAATWVSETAFARGEFKNLALRKQVYGEVKSRWGLGAQTAYKARRAGVAVAHIDPAYTSRTCAECGHVDRANRLSQAWFACRNCGFVAQADRNGSRTIRSRAGGCGDAGPRQRPPPHPEREEYDDGGARNDPGAPIVVTPRSGAGRKRHITASDDRCASPAL